MPKINTLETQIDFPGMINVFKSIIKKMDIFNYFFAKLIIIFTGYVIASFFFKILGNVTVKYFLSIFGKVLVIACLNESLSTSQLMGPIMIIKNHFIMNPISKKKFLTRNFVMGLFISKYIPFIVLKTLRIYKPQK